MAVRPRGGQDLHRRRERVLPLRTWRVLAGSVGLALASLVAVAAPASALTEARIVDVDCGGLTVVQTGLPGHALFRVEALDAATARSLKVEEVRSTPDGRLSVRLVAPLHGVHRLHAEVSRPGVAESEYGEADVDLDDSCHITGTQPAPRPSVTAAPASASGSHHDSAGSTTDVLLVGLVVVLAAAGGGLYWRVRRARSARPA